jgi:hypothetical protein
VKIYTREIYEAIAAAVDTPELRAITGINNIVVGQLPLEPLTDSTDWDPNTLLDILLITDGQDADRVISIAQANVTQEYRVRLYYFHKLTAGENAVDIMSDNLSAISAWLSQITIPVRFTSGVIQSVLPGPGFKALDTGETSFFRGIGLNCSVGYLDLTVKAMASRVSTLQPASTLTVAHEFSASYPANLTALGTIDWFACTGWNGGAERERKDQGVGGVSKIGDLKMTIDPISMIGPTKSDQGTAPMTWTDGTYAETGTAVLESNAVICPWSSFDEFKGEYQIEIDAAATEQQAIICIPNKNCSYKLEARLSDGTSVITEVVEPGDAYDSIFTINFTATGARQKLYVRIYDMVFNAVTDSWIGFRFAALSVPIPPSGPILDYPITVPPVDDVVIDVSASGNNGTNYGAIWTNGKYHGGMFFYGAQHIDVEDPEPFDFGTGDFTISCWIKTNVTGNTHVFIGRYDGVMQFFFMVASNDIIYFNLGVQAGNETAVNDGEWHHCVARRASNILGVIIDKINGTPVASNESVTINEKMGIGTCLGMGYPFTGTVSDLKIYDRALSDAEIAQLYDGEDI